MQSRTGQLLHRQCRRALRTCKVTSSPLQLPVRCVSSLQVSRLLLHQTGADSSPHSELTGAAKTAGLAVDKGAPHPPHSRSQPPSLRETFLAAETHVNCAMTDFDNLDEAAEDDNGEQEELAWRAQQDTEEAKLDDVDEDVSSAVGDEGKLCEDLPPEYVARRRSALRAATTEDLVEAAMHYLRGTQNVKLVSAEEEHAIFPVLLDRLNELHVGQLLDVVESHWARSTLLRYGTIFKDAARDRIAELANAAALQHHRASLKRVPGTLADELADDLNTDGSAECTASPNEDSDAGENDSRVFVFDEAKEEQRGAAGATWEDPILASAVAELDAPTVLRCVVVMGMSAGHRKRDLDLFRVLCAFLEHDINQYKDPHDLVHVLTALARAKIVPSKSFLALLSRRFPVLCKKTPMEPLPCYRAMVNFSRMGHENMSTYRFFADYMLNHMESKIAEEKVEAKRLQKQESAAATPQGDTGKGTVPLHSQFSETFKARQRLRTLSGLSPVMFTRWLLVLARHDAPHQQYLRPLIKPIVVPMLTHLPPPSVTRLLFAMRLFHTGDLELLEPVLNFLCSCAPPLPSAANSESDQPDEAAPPPRDVCLVDLLVVLSILARSDTPVPRNLSQFVHLCQSTCLRGILATAETPKSHGEGEEGKPNLPAPLSIVRPADMCAIANYLLHLQRKPDIPLEALEPLTSLMEVFAERLTFLMGLRVVSLTHVDIFADICQQQQHPDRNGSIERMVRTRKSISQTTPSESPSLAAGLAGEDAYYSALDIDVRDTFFKILAVNSTNTYGNYRPLPGPMQLDFRDGLTRVSVVDLLEAVELHERACPGALRAAPRRFLSRSVLQKLSGEGEEVINVEAHRLELRASPDLLLTRQELARLMELIESTPLLEVRASPAVWRFLTTKAHHLSMSVATQKAEQQLATATGTL